MQTHLRGSLLLMCCAGLVASGACTKSSAPPVTATGPVEPVAEPAKALPVVARVKVPVESRKPDHSAAALLRYLPRDSSVVIGLNWRKARKSSVVQSYDAKLAKAIPKLAEIKSQCGIDPVTALHSAALALGTDPGNKDDLVFAMSGAFEREAFDTCIVALGGTVEGDRYSGEVSAFWPSEGIIVFSTGMSSEQLAMAPGASAWDNDKLMMLVDELDLHAAFWMAGMMPDSLASSFSSMGATPWGGYAFMDIEAWMRATVGFEFATPEDAKSALSMAEMGLQMSKGQPVMKDIGEAISAGTVGNALVLKADLNAEQVQSLQKLLEMAGL